MMSTPPSHFIWKLGKLVAVVVCVSFLSSCKTTFGKLMDHQTAGDEAYREANYAKAEEEYKAAIREAEKLGSPNAMVIICLRSLAQVYIAQNRMSEAEMIYQKRITLADKSLQRDHAYQITVYDDLASFYILENRISEAKPIYERAILLTQKVYGADDMRVAEKLDYYASLLKAKEQDVAASEMEKQAVRIRERAKKESNLEY
jgi:tetratricopeptide (TPR) repeat protein